GEYPEKRSANHPLAHATLLQPRRDCRASAGVFGTGCPRHSARRTPSPVRAYSSPPSMTFRRLLRVVPLCRDLRQKGSALAVGLAARLKDLGAGLRKAEAY